MSEASPTAIRVCPKSEDSRGGVSGHDHGELWPEKDIRQVETRAGYFAIFEGQITDPQPTAIRTILDMIKLRQPKLISWLRGVLPPIPAKRRGDGFTSDAVRAEVGRLEKQQLVPADLLTKPDLEIQLTSDLSLQDFARNALERQLSRIEKSSGFKAPGGQQVNGCVVILDNADSAILACVGGRSFDFLQLNLATSSPGRPLASAIKPFDYAALLEAEPGLSITSTISNSVLSDKLLVGYPPAPSAGGREWNA